MKRKLKIALVGVGLLAATGIGAGLVMADGGGACGEGLHRMHSARSGDFKAMAGSRLERLHADLKLRSDQEPAWQDFSQTISGQAALMGEKLKSWRQATATATTLDRLERVQQGFDDGRLALDQLTAATKRFYSALDKEQQARFDQLTKHFSPGEHAWGRAAGRGV